MTLDHPLLGRDVRLTALGLSYAVIVFIGSLLVHAFHRGLVDSLPTSTIRLIDGYMGGIIILAVLGMTAVPLVYAVFNQGPAVVVIITFAPLLSGVVVTQRVVLTNDAVVTLVVASLAATVAVGMTVARHERSTTTPPRPVEFDGLLIASVVSIIATFAVVRFNNAAPVAMRASIDPWYWFVLVSLIGCLMLWGIIARRFLKYGAFSSASTDSL